MTFSSISDSISEIKYSIFKNELCDGKIYAIAKINDYSLDFKLQADSLFISVENFLSTKKNDNYSVVFMKILLSDAANQYEYVYQKVINKYNDCAISIIEQPPLNYSKIAILFCLIENIEMKRIDKFTVIGCQNELTHYWTANVVNNIQNTYIETNLQLNYLEKLLIDNKLSIKDNCIRTWFFVQNIDINYIHVVKARRENFIQNGLSHKTHYIASTGIEGCFYSKDVTSIFDAYSVGGLKANQLKYLYASQNMNKTNEYGVTFERGSYIEYENSREVFISGTASIDKKGEIVALGNIILQTERMIINVETLLKEASCSFSDVTYIICYLRDIADYQVVARKFTEKFSNIPYIITLAAVCRPGWLIEMECMAIKSKV